jgi:hypothetical protein
MLVEAVATVLGPAIAKAILKKWLRDSALASDVSSSLIDLIKAKTSDFLTQTRTARQFEAIGERVAESLLTVFEAEGANISENGRTAVALAVADTLNKAGIDPALLAENNLEPRLLADYLFTSNPRATRDFSEAETALYERSIQEASQYIVDIGSQLPQFNERTFSELLKRQNQLQEVADQILDEVHRIRQETKQDNFESGLFEVEYRRALIRNLDELQLFGVDASQASRRHKLSVAYVTLSVSHITIPQKSSTEARAGEKPDARKNSKKDPAKTPGGPEEGVPVDRTLETCRKLLILGEAGSGKTTLLQWVAVRAAQRDFVDGLSEWNDLTPFFIRLRQCVDLGLPPPEHFPRFVAPAIAGTMPAGWVHDRLRKGNAVVLVDGLDELGESLRENVRKWLKDLVQTYPNVRFIVSSRPYAVEQDWLRGEGFEDAELLPMELPDITSFIEHWHSAVRNELHVEDERLELDRLGENLKEIVRKSIQLRKLATNPLLCAMLCALHRDRQRKLPSDRIELYDACFRMLVDRRDVERGVDLSDYPFLGYRQKRALLQDFAYWLLKNGYSMVEVPQADQRFRQKLEVLEGVKKEITGTSVRRLFIERSGILREPVKHQVDFTHRTFQEFLGAQAALDDGDVGLLIRNAHHQEWREVVVLAAGLARANEREEIIKQLIARGDNEPVFRHQLHLLAVACLETSIELAPDLKKEVSKRLQKLIPPKNLTEAKSLASAGELALPFLVHKYRKANVEAACVRTLNLIGGDEALSTLEDYYPDGRVAVTSELTKGWDYFDRKEYATRLFGKSVTLELNRPSSLEGLDALGKLETLYVNEAFKIKDLGPLMLLKNLVHLRCDDLYGIRNIPSFSNFSNLVSLYLWGIPTVDIEFLGNLRTLTSLTLGNFQQLSDITPISTLKSLQTLRLYFLPKVADLNPLADLSDLTDLILYNFQSLTDLQPLSKLQELTSLDLDNCHQIKDLSGLSNSMKLVKLDASNCTNLIDISSLSTTIHLERLVLRNCKSITDLGPLSKVTNLTNLDVSLCGKISDLTPLTKLANLKWLNIQMTPAATREIPEELRKKVKPKLLIIK